MNGTAKNDLIKGILSGDREPANREERRAWDREQAAEARRARRARVRVERALASYPKEVAA